MLGLGMVTKATGGFLSGNELKLYMQQYTKHRTHDERQLLASLCFCFVLQSPSNGMTWRGVIQTNSCVASFNQQHRMVSLHHATP